MNAQNVNVCVAATVAAWKGLKKLLASDDIDEELIFLAGAVAGLVLAACNIAAVVWFFDAAPKVLNPEYGALQIILNALGPAE